MENSDSRKRGDAAGEESGERSDLTRTAGRGGNGGIGRSRGRPRAATGSSVGNRLGEEDPVDRPSRWIRATADAERVIHRPPRAEAVGCGPIYTRRPGKARIVRTNSVDRPG